MFEENLSEFLDVDEFGVEATYNGTVSVVGIFDHAYVESQGVESYAPMFYCEAIAGLAHGDTLKINGDEYEVVNQRTDGAGMVTLKLKRTS